MTYLTVEEAIEIAVDNFNMTISECDRFIQSFDIIRATERIFTWLRFCNKCCIIDGCYYVEPDIEDIVKNAIVMYVISYHRDDSDNSTTERLYEVPSYNYLKNNGLIFFKPY